jgi:predicted class III extradiol MEMO1 family dioxygenase
MRANCLKSQHKDKTRLDRICDGDADGFLNLVIENNDPLKWCGFSPIYTFMRAQSNARGSLVRYDQWNIDPQSVVSFAAVDFHRL